MLRNPYAKKEVTRIAKAKQQEAGKNDLQKKHQAENKKIPE